MFCRGSRRRRPGSSAGISLWRSTGSLSRTCGGSSGRGEVGMTVEELDAEKVKKFKLREGEEGLVVSDVAKGGPASSAGIRAGDLIREVNRRQVRSLEGYRNALRRDEAHVYVAVKPKP